MKKILYTILFFLLGLFISSCEKNTGVETPEPQLKVIESDITFETRGGSGYIKVVAPAAVTATSNEEWCRVGNISGTTISLQADPNKSMGGRSATITIQSGEETTEVTAVQTASVFIVKDLVFDVDFVLTSLETTVISDEEVVISISDEWIEVNYEDGTIFITVFRNNTPEARKGTIEVTSKNITHPITINQAGRSLAFEDVLGDYEMSYQTSATSAVFSQNISFAQSTAPGYYTVTGFDVGVLEVKFNNTNRTLEIYGGQNSEPDPNDNTRTIVPLVFTTDGYISWEPANFYKGMWNNAFEGDMMFTFEDSGTYAGKTIFGLYFVSSNQYPVVSGSYTYAGYRYVNISLKKLID